MVKGSPTLHANNFVDPNDWRSASFQTGRTPVELSSGTGFTIGEHSNVTASFHVQEGAELGIQGKAAHWKGKAILEKGATLRVSTSEGAKDRVLDIQGETLLLPTLPEGADATKTILVDLGRAASPKKAKQMAALLKIQTDATNGKWETGSTPDGMLKAAWIPAQK